MSIYEDIDKHLNTVKDNDGENTKVGDLEFGNVNKYTRGIEGMPDWLGYFEKGDLVVLAGYPSCGKTEYTFFLAKNNARKGVKTLYISLELNPEMMVQRLARKRCGINKKMRQEQNITEQQKEQLKREYDSIRNIENLTIVNYKNAPTVETLEKTIRKYHSMGYELFFIDNLGKIAGDINENIRFESITSRLQDLKNNLKTCIFLLHHLSKPSNQFVYTPGGLGKIRGSQKIIDNSSLIFELFRDQDPEITEFEKSKVQLILYKDSADGAVGTVNMKFEKGEYKLYDNIL